MEKSKIKKIVATGLLFTLIGAGASLAIYDHMFDHTKGFCVLSHIPVVGMRHQGKAMVSDIKEKEKCNLAIFAFDSTEDNYLFLDTVSVYYNYKPYKGLEDSIHLLNNYKDHITLTR